MESMHDIFLSYNREDQAKARLFAEGFERAGFTVWWDVTLRSGQTYDQVTEDALRAAKAVVVLWSTKSVKSEWVRSEASIALRNKTLMPAMIELCERPVMFELKQTADLCHWQGEDSDSIWQGFVGDVRKMVSPELMPLNTSAKQMPAPSLALQPASAKPTATALPPTTLAPQRPAPFKFLLSLAALLIVGVASWALLRDADTTTALPAPSTVASNASTTNSAPTTNAPNAADVPLANAIAVLPFTNISPNAEDAYFATGLHEEILNQLAKVSKLKVISRQSVLRYSGSTLSMPAIANELRVGFIMEGSVRYAGNRIRITTQLIEAATDAQVWSETFDEDFADVFAIESQVAMAVANAMKVSFSADEAAQIASIPTTSPEAYALYLQTSRDFSFANQATLDDVLVQMDRALVLDPNFADAYARKAQIFENLGDATQATINRRRAAELAPTRFSPDYARIRDLMSENQREAAVILAEALLARQSDDLSTLALGREVQMWLGNNEAALNYSLRMRELSPAITGYAFYGRLGTLYSRLGRYEEALQAFERNGELSPQGATGQVEMSNVLSALGRQPEAMLWLKSAEMLTLGESGSGGNPLGYSALIFGYSLAGSAADAERLFARFKTMEAQADLPTRARAYLGVGDYDTALALLQELASGTTVVSPPSFLALQQLRDNPYQVEALNRPEFVEARSKL
jgi:TolB-like protein